MKRRLVIGLLALLALASCTTTTRDARRMVRCAARLADTLPDSTLSLIDSVLCMEAYFTERERMEVAMLQGEVLFGDHGQEIPPLMDDEFFDDKPFFSISPELERAADYYARKKKYDKAAHAALYSGFVQQHYGENKIAMQSFKEAELYGDMAGDSLTVAMAQSRMGKLLYGEHLYDEALAMFQSAGNKFGNHLSGKALVLNMAAVCHLMLNDLESAEDCLKQSLLLAEQGHINKVKWKVLNNYAVFYRLQRKFEEAIGCLRQMKESIHSDNELFMFYLNMGYTYMAANELDSAAMYAKRMEGLVPTTDVRDESKVSAYEMLTNLAKMSGNESLALQYREKHEKLLYEVMKEKQEQSVYYIQKLYDYDNQQDMMYKKLIRAQHIIGVCILLLFAMAALFLYHSAKRSKKEAEINANLFHFMQQNEIWKQHYEEYRDKDFDKSQTISNLLEAKFNAMLKLEYLAQNPCDKSYLRELEKEFFGGKNHWEAMMEVFDTLYPSYRATLKEKYPDMTDIERNEILLSRYKLTRAEEAALLGITTSVLDKLREKVRKALKKESENA